MFFTISRFYIILSYSSNFDPQNEKNHLHNFKQRYINLKCTGLANTYNYRNFGVNTD